MKKETARKVPTALKQSAVQKPAVNQKPIWTDEDEEMMRALLSKRRASGFRKPSRDVGGQILTLTTITPNPNTVTATICNMVAVKGSLTRRDLLSQMAEVEFPHRMAQPKNPKWCQGYIAGAIRNGFLDIVTDAKADQSTSTDTATQTPV